ncbi:MAG: nuclear transport factor 2 family protein [Paracoccaceae bacterium]
MTDCVISKYFDAFNAGDLDGMLECATENVAHHVNEGHIRVGVKNFAEFCEHMNQCYREHLTDIEVFLSTDGTRAAAEYVVNGTYLVSDAGLPEATGQTYCLPAGSFFSMKEGRISRVTTY